MSAQPSDRNASWMSARFSYRTRQAAKLIKPGKGALHDPPPPAQSTAMLAAAHGKPRHDMPRPQPAPKGGRVVAAIPEPQAERPAPRRSTS
jgi:hypothetical protein